jgi:beta-glucosidase
MRTICLLLLASLTAPAQSTSGWRLVWSDEFNGAAGTAPDPAKWNFDLGNGVNGWGNREAEVYTNSTNNAFQDGNGNLVIRAIKDSQGGYTSARLRTGGDSTKATDLSWQYGRIEARLKLPFGKGIWPAFWALGENIAATPWPACGEIDIMENFGIYPGHDNTSITNGTAHGPGYSGGSGIGAPYTLPFGETVYDDYHLYAIEWSPDSIVWYVDGAAYHTVTPASLPTGARWIFNAPFFLLLNLAIGGPNTFLTSPDASVTFPKDLLVDYVRVYQSTTIPATTPVITPGRVVNGASYLGAISPGSLAALFGKNLSDGVHTTRNPDGSFPTSAAGVTVSVNGVNAPLIYVSPTQINFQVPWGTAPALAVSVKVSRNSVDSNIEFVTIASTSSPSFFLSEYVNGVAWVTGAVADGCATPVTECSVKAASTYQLWANGLGPKTSPLQDGVPSPLAALQVPGGPGSCRLTIGGQPATVVYCGVAPGEIIDQVNFTYPVGVPYTSSYAGATLTVNGATIHFRVPAPAPPPTSAQRAEAMLARMTQAQKLQFVAGAGGPVTNIFALPRGAGGYIPGIPSLGIPALYFVDGSLGLADSSAPSTALPSALASAASWDLDLAYKFGSVIGAETAAYGLNVNLGGNINLIGREPRDGRTFETKGEDPILAGKITAAHIRAVQDRHVIGGAKHYALNDQETGRTFADVRIGERGARESDLLAFEIAIKDSNAQSVMCSYNLVNGVYACENPHLLNDVLKGEWGFPGFVMSDWWGTHSTATAALAGLDQEQPDNANFSRLGEAVANGQVPQSRLDDMVRRILHAMYEVGLFDYPNTITPIDRAASEAIAQEAEEQGAVLLKNAGGLLPLDSKAVRSIAVTGWNADVAVLSGGGSAQVWPTGGGILEGKPNPPGWANVIWDPSSPLNAIQAMAPGATVRFSSGRNAAEAAALAAASDVAVVFVSQWTSEGMDMPSLNFTDVIHSISPLNQDALVAAVAAANPRTVVVMQNGGAQVMPWLPNVGAVLEAWYPGQRGAQAIANILFGVVNPSGKLPITFPASVADLPNPTIAGTPSTSLVFPVTYSEGYLVGYKWYDSKGMTPLFPFGFGLSYTTFSIENASVLQNLPTLPPPPRGFSVLSLVTNTGAVAGAEVLQVYLGLPATTGEPPKRLVGWSKIYLRPGQGAFIFLEVKENDSSHPMSYWDTNSNTWQTAPGDYPVYVGNSSANLTLADELPT